ncbi:zinc-dependent metalloprotease [Flavobacteriaceae bacterium XHP0103]|uniref:zinc-dependent metalloprotease n=1 Tax=Marixanthotalea marina TaxID=2844359 RepID=UPI002989E0AD|nr:zinc-dependent metalloprotease [Marixanthotalea marina]MBU3821827.1 zinc-dependent metalloprotease [Marixanthotalea marina]
MNLSNLKFDALHLAIFFLLTTLSLSSQNKNEIGCATETSQKTLEFYNSIRSELKISEKNFMSKSASSKEAHDIQFEEIPIKAHIIRNSNGNSGLSTEELHQSINNLNETFKEAFIQFKVNDDINYIDDDGFCHFNKSNEKELTAYNYAKGYLNIYFVENLENQAENSICGYANISESANLIFVKNSCVTNGSTLPHEIGHLLSLIHTHGPNDNQTTELVDGSNCDTDGDGICDTPADPKLSSENLDNFCNYVGTETDANGDKYQPDTRNIMSYAYKGCRTQFTSEQSARMYAFYQYIKNSFINPNEEDVSEETFASLKLYPNPVTGGLLSVYIPTAGTSVHYKISNLYGQLFSEGVLDNTKQIDVNNLSSGAYMLTLSNEKTKVVKKFIK